MNQATEELATAGPRTAAHRPSRRNVIVTAAVTVFARQGFSDTSIQEVATEAGVAPTAVYYHFSGKEELFEAALRHVLDSINEVVAEARADDEPGDPELLARVISAVWTWLEEHPDAARLVHHHLPGATSKTRVLQDEFEALHVTRAFAYITPPGTLRTKRTAAARHASETLAVRTFIALTLLIHPMRAQNGPLVRFSGRSLRAGLIDTSSRILDVA
jgi:AcrR family transcriptional regulator